MEYNKQFIAIVAMCRIIRFYTILYHYIYYIRSSIYVNYL